MRVGLVDVDNSGKVKKWGSTIYPNLALCKIAFYHKSKGDEVEWATPMSHYDRVYMSKIFKYSADDVYIYDADEVVRGGTGYDLHSLLPQEIDDCQPDLSIYPTVPTNTAYGFLTRGCPNKCAWCVVPRKEGLIRPYWDIERVANGKKYVVLMDNNILAAGDYAKEQFDKIIAMGLHVDFNQALDARLVTEDFARQMAQIKWIKSCIRFGCDTPGQIKEVERAREMLFSYGFRGHFFLYTMIGGKRGGKNWYEMNKETQRTMFTENFNRIHHFWEYTQNYRKNRIGCEMLPYAQPYRDPDDASFTPPQWQKDMAQWCNKHQLFAIMDFKDFSPRKGFLCSEWIDKYYSN